MEYKMFHTALLKADATQGIVEHIVAVMGNTDLGDDVIHPGAFTKTITESKGKIRVLDQHRADSVMRVVGKPLEMRELTRAELPPELLAQYPSATGGLYAKTQYLMDTPEGEGVFNRIVSGAIDEYSIGYDPLDVDYSSLTGPDGKRKTVRNLRTLKLYEYSPVLWGMNPATTTLSAKGASGASGLPLADRARAWDATAAEGRVREWAGATDGPNSKYGQAFFWVDGTAKEDFTSYKLQFADVVDGKLTAIPRGIFAVAAVLQGSRGGVNIPEGDKAAIKAKVAAYYAKMRTEFNDDSIVAPWEGKSAVKPKDGKPWDIFHEGDKWNVYKIDENGDKIGQPLGSHPDEAAAQEQLRALYANEPGMKANKSVDLSGLVREVVEEFMEQFPNTMDCMYCVTTVFDDHVIVCEYPADDYYSVAYTVNPDGSIVFAPSPEWVEGTMVFAPDVAMGAEGEMSNMKRGQKAGRVFASRNEARLRSILKLVNEALAEIDKPDETSDNSEGKSARDVQRARPTESPTQKSADIKALIDIELEQLQLLQE